MRHFVIIPTKAGSALREFIAFDETAIFHAVGDLDCDEAAVFEGNTYRFSLRPGPTGTWRIFRREQPRPRRLVSLFSLWCSMFGIFASVCGAAVNEIGL